MTLTHTLPNGPDGTVRQSVEPQATFTVIAWHDPLIDRTPGAMVTASDDLWLTGTGDVFDRGECSPSGR